MDMMLGRQCGSYCDSCCVCGAFCQDHKCGRDFDFNGTASGGSNGTSGNCAGSGNAADCAFVMNVVYSYTFLGATTASDWNSSFKPTFAAFDAKSDTNVCRFESSDANGTVCGGGATATLSGGVLHVYYGTDEKWHAVVAMPYEENTGLSTEIGGDSEFASSGLPMDCENFSLNIALSVASGTPVECNPPTNLLVENAP